MRLLPHRGVERAFGRFNNVLSIPLFFCGTENESSSGRMLAVPTAFCRTAFCRIIAVQVAAMLICGSVQHWVLPFGVPAALLCEAILHANNMRDIEQDRSAGISTLATVKEKM